MAKHGNQHAKEAGHSRRTHLKKSALSLSAAALGTAAFRSLSARAHAAGRETLKVALLGCGGRGAGAVTQALSTEGPVVLWAMADAFPGRIETAYEQLTTGQDARYDREAHEGYAGRINVPPERRFTGVHAYRDAIDSGVDVVLCASPPYFRPHHFEYAVEKGKHLFVEKPLATDAPGIRRILAANEKAQEKNLKIVVGLQRHHHAAYQETIRRIHEGAVGEILYLRCYWNQGSIWTFPRTPEMSELDYQLANWQYFTWNGGDHIVEQHIHNLDVCNWVKGEHPVEAVGMGGRQVRLGPEHGQIYDHHAVEFTYADGTKLFSQCRQISGCWNSMTEYVHGTQGLAEVHAARIEGAHPWRFRGSVPNPYQASHDLLFAAIRNDTPRNEVPYAAENTMTAILGRMATYSGQRITWDEALASDLDLGAGVLAAEPRPPVEPGRDGEYPVAMPGITEVL